MDKIKSSTRKLLRISPIILTVTIILCCIVFIINNDFDEILNYTPDNLWLAALVLWGFYGLKSMSVVFPLTALFVFTGLIYPFWLAIIVNIVGLIICVTLPYLVGRVSGGAVMEHITDRFPKAKNAVNYSHDNNLFTSYITRAVVVVPGDIVSMMHGAVKMPFKPYLLGSLLGIMPEMLVQTYAGGQLNNLDLKMILILVGLIILTMTFSFLLNKKVSKYGKEYDIELSDFDIDL